MQELDLNDLEQFKIDNICSYRFVISSIMSKREAGIFILGLQVFYTGSSFPTNIYQITELADFSSFDFIILDNYTFKIISIGETVLLEMI